MAEQTKTHSAYDGQIVMEMATYTSWRGFDRIEQLERAVSDNADFAEGGTAYRVWRNFRIWLSRVRSVEVKPGKKAPQEVKDFATWWQLAAPLYEAKDYAGMWDSLYDSGWGLINGVLVRACDATLREIPAAKVELQFTEDEVSDPSFLAEGATPS